MIVDLSSPASASVNNGISSEEFSIHYIKKDEIIGWFLSMVQEI